MFGRDDGSKPLAINPKPQPPQPHVSALSPVQQGGTSHDSEDDNDAVNFETVVSSYSEPATDATSTGVVLSSSSSIDTVNAGASGSTSSASATDVASTQTSIADTGSLTSSTMITSTSSTQWLLQYSTLMSPKTPSVTISLARTHTAPSTSTGSLSAAGGGAQAPQPNEIPSEEQSSGSFNGALLAGIITPIVVVLALGVGILLCLRRRRRRRELQQKGNEEDASGSDVIPIIHSAKEKQAAEMIACSSTSASQSHLVTPDQPHLITSPDNSTYFTGLDTMSVISGATIEQHGRNSEDPPPPYRARSTSTRGLPARTMSARSGVASFLLTGQGSSPLLSPFDTQEEAEAEAEDADADADAGEEQGQDSASLSSSRDSDVDSLSPFADPPVSPSWRSITSTLYSSDASVFEARPARRSIGGAHMVGGPDPDPFADPPAAMSDGHDSQS